MKTIAPESLTTSQRQAIYAIAQDSSGTVNNIASGLPKAQAHALGLSKKLLVELVHKIVQVRSRRFNDRPRPLAWHAASVGTGLRSRITARLTQRLVAGFAYRQPESDWVDVFNTIFVQLTKKPGEASEFIAMSWVKYHPEKRWKANESKHLLLLNPLDDFTTIGGLLTIFRKADRHAAAIPCRWYEQSRGFEVKQVPGYLVGSYHIEAESAEVAVRLAKRRDKQATAARQARADLAEGKESAVLSTAVVQRVFGFCLAGIRSFCEANDLDLAGKYTLGELRAAVAQRREMNTRSYAPYLRKLGVVLK